MQYFLYLLHFLTLDRLLALEMGKPVLINDQDCEVVDAHSPRREGLQSIVKLHSQMLSFGPPGCGRKAFNIQRQILLNFRTQMHQSQTSST